LHPSHVITPKCKPEEDPPQTAHDISLNETNWFELFSKIKITWFY